MGQYYNIIIKHNSENKVHAYDRHIDGEYTLAKLMEHSWLFNGMVNAICKEIYRKPAQVAWVGDYCENEEMYKLAWKPRGGKFRMLHEGKNGFDMTRRYIVNHTKKQILDCWVYTAKCLRKMPEKSLPWVPHPLPLLTAMGNGLGNGDYSGVNQDKVGMWAWDTLEVLDYEDVNSADYEDYEYIDIIFYE